MQYDVSINRLAKLNGFSGSGEVADLLNLYTYELKAAPPVKLLNLIIKAKILKGVRQ